MEAGTGRSPKSGAASEIDGVSLAYATRDVDARLRHVNRFFEPDPLFTVTVDDLALNAVSDALKAGRTVVYRGSVEAVSGWQVTWMERCEIDCCMRRQAQVRVRRETEGAESLLRHVSADHLMVIVAGRAVGGPRV